MCKVYLASGWFDEISMRDINVLEDTLLSLPVDAYLPRIHGKLLNAGEKNDASVRKSIYEENMKHIDEADIVVANVNSAVKYYDQGTMYELGYALAENKHVICVNLNKNPPKYESIHVNTVYSLHELKQAIRRYIERIDYDRKGTIYYISDSSLYEEPDYFDNMSILKLLDYYEIVCLDENIKYAQSTIAKLKRFTNKDLLFAVIDNRHPVVSMAIGAAKSVGLPVVTYTNHDYGVNVMLLESIHSHIKGSEELVKFVEALKSEGGINSLDRSDTKNIRTY